MHEPPAPEPEAIVRAGYDRLGPRYRDWALEAVDPQRDRWLDAFTSGVRVGGRVVELGCGPGLVAARLSPRFDVLGVDLSAAQVALARTAVPRATFVVANMTRLDLSARSADGVVALFSLIHLPSADLPPMLARISDWLRPGGLLLATLGTIEGDGIQADWLGVPMYCGGSSPDRTRKLFEAAGFSLVDDWVARMAEPQEGDVDFHWLLARRPE